MTDEQKVFSFLVVNNAPEDSLNGIIQDGWCIKQICTYTKRDQTRIIILTEKHKPKGGA